MSQRHIIDPKDLEAWFLTGIPASCKEKRLQVHVDPFTKVVKFLVQDHTKEGHPVVDFDQFSDAIAYYNTIG